LTKRAVDVLAYFDRPGISNEPTEAAVLRYRVGGTIGRRRPGS